MPKTVSRGLTRFLSAVIALLCVCDLVLLCLTPWWLNIAYRHGYGWMGYYFGASYGASHPGGTYFLMLTFIFLCGLLLLGLMLQGLFILRSIEKDQPFCRRNAVSFRNAGILSVCISFSFLYKMFFSPSILTILCIGVFALFALFMFVLSRLFALAAQIKEENELTI